MRWSRLAAARTSYSAPMSRATSSRNRDGACRAVKDDKLLPLCCSEREERERESADRDRDERWGSACGRIRLMWAVEKC